MKGFRIDTYEYKKEMLNLAHAFRLNIILAFYKYRSESNVQIAKRLGITKASLNKCMKQWNIKRPKQHLKRKSNRHNWKKQGSDYETI